MHLLMLLDIYLAISPISESTIANKAAGQAHFFRRMRAGASVTVDRAQRILQWFSDHWPLDLEWPLEIPRPDPGPDAVCFAGVRTLTSTSPAPSETPAGARPVLSEAGHLTNVAAWARALGFNPQNVRNALARFGEGGPKWGHMPRKDSEAYLIMEELFKLGESRVALSKLGYEAGRMGRRLGL